MDLSLLSASAEVRLSEAAYAGIRNSESLSDALRPLGRSIDLTVLGEVVDEAIRRFSQRDEDGRARTECDQWLGIRLHASLRLTRAEAALDGVWQFLAAYAFPDYVVWRWQNTAGLESRFFGSDVKKQAFKRLWWTTELFRNGESYEPALEALSKADIANTLTSLRVTHSRPVALGILEYIDTHKVTSRQINNLSKQLNTSAVTVALDRAFTSQDEATELDQVWISANPDIQEIMSNPRGPRHGEVSKDAIVQVRSTLENIIDLPLLREYRKTPNSISLN